MYFVFKYTESVDTCDSPGVGSIVTWADTIKMAAPLQTYFKDKQSSDTIFLNNENEKPIDIHWRIQKQLREEEWENRQMTVSEVAKSVSYT